MTKRPFMLCIAIMATLLVAVGPLRAAEADAAPGKTYDVVVYGGTSAAVTAAVQVARMDRSVVMVSPMAHIGGLTASGLGRTDFGEAGTIGGLSYEFYKRGKDHYDDPDAWEEGSQESFSASGVRGYREDAAVMLSFEPHVAENIFNAMVKEAGVTVVRGQRLDREDGVVTRKGRIESITTLAGDTYKGKVFIDATYEGDLMAAAGVRYTVGRESQSKYDEKWAGVHKDELHHRHYFEPEHPVSPYVEPGNPDSGLLPRVHGNPPGKEGTSDDRVQAYCFRMCMTKVESNKVEWEKPENYDPQQYELLFRAIENDAVAEAGKKPQLDDVLKIDPMPNKKTDTNNRGPFSTDNIGQNYEYPEASYEKREQIVQNHLTYQQGLMWTLANHPRIPEYIREQASEWGLAKDEFADNNHWPYKIYVREARRMVGQYVMTEHDCLGRKSPPRPIALGSYTMDSHNTQRFITEEGYVQNEGDIGVHPNEPYEIAYGSIVPKVKDTANLLVPAAMSASHIAYGSIRMEPVFMMLGQAAGTGAVHAIEQQKAVQNIEYSKLRDQLVEDGMIVSRKQSMPVSIKQNQLAGIVADNADAEQQGAWELSGSVEPYVGRGYLHDGDSDKAGAVRYPVKVPEAGRYQLRVSYTAHENRASNASVTIHHADGRTKLLVNQQREPDGDGPFYPLGMYQFDKGWTRIVISNENADGYVIADAVQLLPVE